MKTIFLLVFAMCLQLSSKSQVTIVDFIRIKNNHRNEALYFYENNWKAYRDEAIKRGVIQSYQLLTTSADSAANFHLMLVTVFKDSAQYLAGEASFEPIIKSLRPNGPALLNEKKPADFRENVFYKVASTVFESERESFELQSKPEGGMATYSDPQILITQNADYFMPGQEFELSIASLCENSFRITSVTIGGEKQVWQRGSVMTYRFPVGSPGGYEMPVTISFQNNKGQVVRKKYKVEFTVGMPITSIGLDKMNVLYIGIDNPVTIASSEGGDEKIIVSIQGGGATLTKVGNGKLIVRASAQTDNCFITVSVDNRQVGRFQYRVRNLPLPHGTIAGYASGDTIPATVFRHQAGVMASIRDFPIDVKYSITGYTVFVQTPQGEVKSASSTGAAFSDAAKKLIEEFVKPGAVVTIGEITAVDPGGRKLKLMPLIYPIK